MIFKFVVFFIALLLLPTPSYSARYEMGSGVAVTVQVLAHVTNYEEEVYDSRNCNEETNEACLWRYLV